MKKEIYRHWGNNKFVLPYFTPITNNEFGNKPHGGLYACPTKDVDISWDRWCKSNDFMTDRLNKHFDFTLKDNARVLEIKDKKDLLKLKGIIDFNSDLFFIVKQIDFEKLAKDYDAIMVWIYRSTDCEENIICEGMYYWLYGWDVDTLLVLNPDIIEVID